MQREGLDVTPLEVGRVSSSSRLYPLGQWKQKRWSALYTFVIQQSFVQLSHDVRA